ADEVRHQEPLTLRIAGHQYPIHRRTVIGKQALQGRNDVVHVRSFQFHASTCGTECTRCGTMRSRSGVSPGPQGLPLDPGGLVRQDVAASWVAKSDRSTDLSLGSSRAVAAL